MDRLNFISCRYLDEKVINWSPLPEYMNTHLPPIEPADFSKKTTARNLSLFTLGAITLLAVNPMVYAASNVQLELTNPQVVAGEVTIPTITTTTTDYTIDIKSTRAIVEWGKFNLPSGYNVTLNFSGAKNGAIINRILDKSYSKIYGGLRAENGIAIFVNPNGFNILGSENTKFEVNSSDIFFSRVDFNAEKFYKDALYVTTQGEILNLNNYSTNLNDETRARWRFINSDGSIMRLGQLPWKDDNDNGYEVQVLGNPSIKLYDETTAEQLTTIFGNSIDWAASDISHTPNQTIDTLVEYQKEQGIDTSDNTSTDNSSSTKGTGAIEGSGSSQDSISTETKTDSSQTDSGPTDSGNTNSSNTDSSNQSSEDSNSTDQSDSSSKNQTGSNTQTDSNTKTGTHPDTSVDTGTNTGNTEQNDSGSTIKDEEVTIPKAPETIGGGDMSNESDQTITTPENNTDKGTNSSSSAPEEYSSVNTGSNTDQDSSQDSSSTEPSSITAPVTGSQTETETKSNTDSNNSESSTNTPSQSSTSEQRDSGNSGTTTPSTEKSSDSNLGNNNTSSDNTGGTTPSLETKPSVNPTPVTEGNGYNNSDPSVLPQADTNIAPIVNPSLPAGQAKPKPLKVQDRVLYLKEQNEITIAQDSQGLISYNIKSGDSDVPVAVISTKGSTVPAAELKFADMVAAVNSQGSSTAAAITADGTIVIGDAGQVQSSVAQAKAKKAAEHKARSLAAKRAAAAQQAKAVAQAKQNKESKQNTNQENKAVETVRATPELKQQLSSEISNSITKYTSGTARPVSIAPTDVVPEVVFELRKKARQRIRQQAQEEVPKTQSGETGSLIFDFTDDQTKVAQTNNKNSKYFAENAPVQVLNDYGTSYTQYVAYVAPKAKKVTKVKTIAGQQIGAKATLAQRAAKSQTSVTVAAVAK